MPRAEAAVGAGVSYDTLYVWVRRGLGGDAPEPFASLARRLYEAEVELFRGVLESEGETRALEWLCARRFPHAFGQGLHEPAEDIDPGVAGGGGGALDVLRQWFFARPARLIEIARETVAPAAVEQTRQGDTKP